MALPARATTIISEFMASNATTITDQDGDYADWLELYNPDSTPANLKGWYLTNKATKLNKWKIPAVTLQPGACLVVFCSEKNYTDPTKPLATNFNISASGGYLALVESDGATIASYYTFPVQYTDVSYGVSQPAAGAEAAQTGLFRAATPGATNGDHTNIILGDMATLSAPPGLFTGSTSVTIGGAASGEHIRYVLVPSSTAGANIPAPTAASPQYTGPLTISSTTLLKAAVFSADDSQRGLPATALYVQLDNSSGNRADTFTSNLPLVVFDDHGMGLLPNDATKYPGWIGVYGAASGKTASLTQAADFFLPDTMKDHGFTSASFPKQSYDIDLTDTLGDDADEAVLGMDDAKDWDSISAWYFDRTYIHNAFVYSLASSMGHWAPQTSFAEMFIHSAGGALDTTSYSGIVSMTDRIKIASNRVNIFDIDVDDITAPNVTGGYILKIDHPDPDAYSFTTTAGDTVQLDSPELDVLAPQQTAYITGYVQQMENAMYADQGSGWATHTYTSYLDRPSWIDYHLLTVLTENPDGLSFSEYFTKDVNGPIVAGPMWDFDRTMGSADGRDGFPAQWSPQGNDLWANGWWGVLGRDPDFMQAWVDRWQQLRGNVLSNANVANLVNSLAAQVGSAAAARDSARWPDDKSRFGDWSGEIANMNSWLATRVQFIDSQFAATPSVSNDGTTRTLTAAAGSQIAYTLDGTDPRLSGGGLSPTAQLVAGPVSLSATQAYSARSYEASMASQYPGSPWSSPIGGSGRLVNVSSRAVTTSGEATLIDGFVVSGPANSQEQVLLRAAGPTLVQFNTGSSVLTQTTMSVFDSSGNLIASDTGWGSNPNPGAVANAATVTGAFAFTTGSADSALLLNLAPGAYTVQVSGVGKSTGLALAEVYEVGSSGSRIINFSSRGLVGSGSPMITGVVVSGTASQQVLLRADGPSLSGFSVSNYLAQPVLQLFDSSGNLVASNTGWGTNSNAAQIATVSSAVGAFALTAGSADSALLVTLQPGNYTMQVSGLGGTSGVALAEEYSFP
ncbi:MAG TPA: CotH kinase family protein [Opitutaceae bacterium]|nr:CotH kinase family protein [Opitutaceae bacterium]